MGNLSPLKVDDNDDNDDDKYDGVDEASSRGRGARRPRRQRRGCGASVAGAGRDGGAVLNPRRGEARDCARLAALERVLLDRWGGQS